MNFAEITERLNEILYFMWEHDNQYQNWLEDCEDAREEGRKEPMQYANAMDRENNTIHAQQAILEIIGDLLIEVASGKRRYNDDCSGIGACDDYNLVRAALCKKQ